MRVCVMLVGLTLGGVLSCKTPPAVTTSNQRGALLLPNLAVATVDSGNQIQRFSADGKQAKMLFPKTDNAKTQPLPDGLGYVVIGDTTATLVSGIEDYPPLTLSWSGPSLVGAVMPTRGAILTLDSAGAIQSWQWEQKNEGSLVKLQQAGSSTPLTKGIFSTDGKFVLTQNQGATIARIWDTKTGGQLYFTSGFTDEISAMAFSQDGQVAVVGTANGEVGWFQNQAGVWSVAARFKDHPKGVQSIAISSDHLLIATGDGTGIIRFFGSRFPQSRFLGAFGVSYELKQSISAHVGTIHSLAFSSDGHRIVSSGEDKTIRVFSLDFGDFFALANTSPTIPVKKGAFSPNGLWFVSTNQDNLMRIWNLTALEALPWQFNFPSTSKFGSGFEAAGLNDVAVSNDWRSVVSAHGDGQIRVWNAFSNFTPLSTVVLLTTLSGHQKGVNSVTVSPDSTLILSTSDDQTARLWQNIAPYHQLGMMSSHTDRVLFGTFSKDGKHVATTSVDQTAKIWDIQDPTNPKLLATVSGHTSKINTAAFSQDGTLLLTGGEEGLVNIWDLTDLSHPVQKASLAALKSPAVRSLAISPDGTILLTGTSDGATQLWDLITRQYLANPTVNIFRDTVPGSDEVMFVLSGKRFLVVQGGLVYFCDLPATPKTTEFSID